MDDMGTHTSTDVQRTSDTRRRRGAYVRFGLAGVALLGIGAAATSAAWTDQAWFSTSATAATVKLDASADGTSWIAADTSGAAQVIAAISGLNQGANVQRTIYVKNSGDVPLTVTCSTATSGTLWSGSGTGNSANPTVALGALGASSLAAGAQTSATLTVTTAAAWDASFQGKSGVITVTCTGQS
jgi:predicted ribosomally synthesized peptide with SipW-like signal peptide